MLWLAIHLPNLPLDLLCDAANDTQPPLVVEESHGQTRTIAACNAAAAAHGVRAGQTLASALALCGSLHVVPRRPRDERAALERLATWVLAYSSQVGLSPFAGVQLEIEASQRLFGGLVPLTRRLGDEVAALGYRAQLAVAPTPAGARLLARAGERRIVRGLPALERAVRKLPLTTVGAPLAARPNGLRAASDAPTALAEIPAEAIAGLEGIGVRRFDALLRLPRAELARRFGHAVPHYLDRLLGRRPEPVAPFRAPEHFRTQVELPYAVEHTEGLAFVLRRLLRELCAWLVVRQLALLRARITLGHEGRAPTEVALGLCAPSGDAEHLAGLARAQIDRLVLPAPVLTFALEACECVALGGDNRDLFLRAGEREDIARAIERLGSRLGTELLHVPALVSDHRPEKATAAAGVERIRSAGAGARATGDPSRGRSPRKPRTRTSVADSSRATAAVATASRVAQASVDGHSTARRWAGASGDGKVAAPARAKTGGRPAHDDEIAAPPGPRPLYLLDPPQPLEWWLYRAGGMGAMEGPERIESGWWDGAPVARDYYRVRTGQGIDLWIYRERAPRDTWFVHGLFA
jgi:protein ImuB